MNQHFLTSEPGAKTIEVSGAFPHPVERIWRAWTEADQLKHWFGADGPDFASMEVDVRVGGRWRFVLGGEDATSALEGEYLVVEPNHRLVFTWSHVQETPDGLQATPKSQVSVTFRQVEGGAEIDLRHERIQTIGARANVSYGWTASFTRLSSALGGLNAA